jgi:hypothetical protein
MPLSEARTASDAHGVPFVRLRVPTTVAE